MKIRRRLTALAATMVVAVGTVLVTLPDRAAAHGVAMMPGGRTFLCFQDGLTETGEIIPNNPACADAVAQSGTTPLYNWFAVLNSNAAGGTTGTIPDGSICSAGDASPFDFSPYNAARADWPVTHLTAGQTIEIQYSNWAAHPGSFDVYVTTDGWTPTTPLAWSDLELIDSVTDPPQSGGPGAFNFYFWDFQLPQRSGQHMIMIHWIRSDSPENFYSCSDVVFDGGNGEVTGIGRQ